MSEPGEGANPPKQYAMEPTAKIFHARSDYIRGIRGPVGSGKSVIGVMECLFRAQDQHAIRNVRRSKGVIIRSTYPDLFRTTLKTFDQWVPPHIVTHSRNTTPIERTIQWRLPDNTLVHCDIEFLALETAADVRKLDSLELTWAFINEARYLPGNVFENLLGRLKRYPAKKDGGYSWTGMWMDTNPPTTSHWWYRMAEEIRPCNALFLSQPPALKLCEPGKGFGKDGKYIIHPQAENVQNQNDGANYWYEPTLTNSDEFIRVMLMNNYGSIYDGRPVYENIWNHQTHVSRTPLEIIKGLPIWLGWDFGLTPACVIGQLSPKGQIRILRSLSSTRGGVYQFATEQVKPMLALQFRGHEIISVGDPAGMAGSQHNMHDNCFGELKKLGIPSRPAHTNDLVTRLAAVQGPLTRMAGGEPAFIVNPDGCMGLIEGFNGGYHFPKINSSGAVRYQDKPEKNEASHEQDGCQYLCMEMDPQGAKRNARINAPVVKSAGFGGYL